MPDHPHCHSTALVFSLYTRRDIDSDDSYARPLIHACAQPIVCLERVRKLRAGHRAETRQTETQTKKEETIMKRNASKRNEHHAFATPTNQSFGVCEVYLATLKIAITISTIFHVIYIICSRKSIPTIFHVV